MSKVFHKHVFINNEKIQKITKVPLQLLLEFSIYPVPSFHFIAVKSKTHIFAIISLSLK